MTVRAPEVETVARAHDTFNARDVEGLISVTHPHCEWFPFRAQLEGTSYQGHAGVRRFVRDMEEDWSRFSIVPEELTQAGDTVFVLGHVTGTGRGSGVDVDFLAGFVFELRDGLIMRIKSYSDPAAAREAAGLDP
jgi:ketosteroid isomerase-like protein